METVRLLVLDIELAVHHKNVLLEKVNQTQKEKALRIKSEIDQVRSLASSFLMNMLSNEPLHYNDTGKPFYENGPHFNVSHSGKYVVMAVSPDKEIGVDIEECVEKDLSILDRIFNEAEIKTLKEHADFYYLWCAKESLIKCMGSSINHIKEIPSLPLNGLKTFKGKDYQCKTFIYEKHIISLTLEGNEDFDVKIEKLEKLVKKEATYDS